MRTEPKRLRWIPIVCLLTLIPAGARAQTTRTTDRLFLNFIEDATRVETQWWEGQLEYDEGDLVDTSLVRGVVAFRVMADLEVGGRVGFGNTDTPAGLPDGTGATDLDAWAKYYMAGGGRNEFAVGGVVTVPTGDDTAGLGTDAFSFGAFGAIRHRLQQSVVTGKVGLRVNGDARFLGLPEQNGKVSPSLGVGILVPWSDRVGFIGEFNFETERYDGGDEDTRVLGGLTWRVDSRGLVRAAVALGLTDGAPDAQVLAGYAYTF